MVAQVVAALAGQGDTLVEVVVLHELDGHGVVLLAQLQVAGIVPDHLHEKVVDQEGGHVHDTQKNDVVDVCSPGDRTAAAVKGVGPDQVEGHGHQPAVAPDIGLLDILGEVLLLPFHETVDGIHDQRRDDTQTQGGRPPVAVQDHLRKEVALQALGSDGRHIAHIDQHEAVKEHLARMPLEREHIEGRDHDKGRDLHAGTDQCAPCVEKGIEETQGQPDDQDHLINESRDLSRKTPFILEGIKGEHNQRYSPKKVIDCCLHQRKWLHSSP